MQEEDLLNNQNPVEVPPQVGPYKILETIGSGANATVYKALHVKCMVTVALKCIPKKNLTSKIEFEILQREVGLMKAMDHPFIASLFEVLDDSKNFYIAIEHVENGNLLDFINLHKGLQESQARRIFYQIITCLEYLHVEKHVVHRDLKAENVLLDKYLNIRLVDFGLSKTFKKTDPFLMTTCGSPAYVSPEIIKELPYTAAADIWSAGVLLYAMVVGTLPFYGDNISALLNQILTASPPLPNNLSPELKLLLSRLLVKDPRGRIKLQEIKEHPWLADFEETQMLAEDKSLIKSLKVMDVQNLEPGVLSEMKAIGYDVRNLLQEIKSISINSRTAAYKILRRQRTIEEINLWQTSRPSKILKIRDSDQQPLPARSDTTPKSTTRSETPNKYRHTRIRKTATDNRRPASPLSNIGHLPPLPSMTPTC
ncbi:hypothetical protein M9Y10_009973 [Tritrichomonas musculus]|uniref:Protein kinase domain-containing protein n=1 Tax=Tritrichomonas musculus TaxID=1915356 RepID=A0ABR2IQ11_9EUKA